MLRLVGPALLAGAALCGCALQPAAPVPPPASPLAQGAGSPGASAARFRCDQGTEVSVRFSDDTAVIDSPAGSAEVLLRDAGGLTPQQTVYSNTRLRAEFGLGPAGRGARLHYLPEQRLVHCVRD